MTTRVEAVRHRRPLLAAPPALGLLAIPGAISAVLIATVYLPAHPDRPVPQALAAAIGVAYVAVMAVLLPRGARSLVLAVGRAAGDGSLVRPTRTPMWDPPGRVLAGVGISALASAGLAAAAAAVTAMAAPGTFQHALGSLATVANLGLLLATLVPVPGLAGWEAVRALARLRCAEPSHAMAHAARAARACACAFAALLASLAVLAGDPLLAGLGALLAGAVWVQTGIARRLDAARRFLAERTAGQLAQTITSVVRADDRIRDLAPAARSRPALVLDRTGMFLGATGPRQLEAASRRPAARCGDAIVAAGALRIVDGDTPAAEVAGELEASGIVLVRGERRYGAIEAGDLEAQLRTWADADDAAVRSAHAGQARA